MNTRKLIFYSLFTAIIFISTYSIKFPTPFGFAHVGNISILFISITYGPYLSMFSGAIGTMLADILGGYFIWAPFSLFIHGLQGYITGKLANVTSSFYEKFVAIYIGSILSTALYLMANFLLYEKPGLISSILGDICESIISIIGALLLSIVYGRHIKKI